MALLLTLLAVLTQGPVVPSPANPMAGVAADRITSVLVRESHGSFRAADEVACTIGREGARAFAAAVARARPRPAQDGIVPADMVMLINLEDGSSVQVVGGRAEIRNGPSAIFMIDTMNYAFDRDSLRAMDEALGHCEGGGAAPAQS